jgi:hypothetical protein
MQKELIEFLKGIGVSQSAIDALNKEEKESDFDVKKYIESHQTTQEKLFENKHKDRIVDQSELDKKFDILRGTMAQKLNKKFNLGYARKELETMDFEDVLEKAVETMDKTIEETRGQGDQELIKKNKILQETNAAIKEELDGIRERSEKEIAAAKTEFDKKLTAIEVDKIFEDEYSKYGIGIEKALIPVVKKQVKDETLAFFDVASDGTLAGKDGTHAQSFDGKGIYKHVSEPIRDLFAKYNVPQKSQIVEEIKGIKTPINVSVDKLSPAARNLLGRIKKQTV